MTVELNSRTESVTWQSSPVISECRARFPFDCRTELERQLEAVGASRRGLSEAIASLTFL